MTNFVKLKAHLKFYKRRLTITNHKQWALKEKKQVRKVFSSNIERPPSVSIFRASKGPWTAVHECIYFFLCCFKLQHAFYNDTDRALTVFPVAGGEAAKQKGAGVMADPQKYGHQGGETAKQMGAGIMGT